ncbi:RDD family protein [Yinghuangia aomiensis]
MSDLVTGEAVSLDLQPARLASRAIAFTLDLLMQGACLLLFGWGLGTLLTGVDPALGTAVVLVFVVAVLLGWPVGWETATRGRSPGKMALGLRVVRDDGGPVRFRHALVRGLVGIFADFWTTVGCGAVISSLASTRGNGSATRRRARSWCGSGHRARGTCPWRCTRPRRRGRRRWTCRG